MKRLFTLPALFFAASMAAPALATELAKPFTPAAEIEQSLHQRPKTRDFPIGRGPAGIVSDRPSIPILIQFDQDSARILPESQGQLAECALALKRGLKDAVVAVAGHASTEGDEDYNLLLSQRRAQSVKRYLVEFHQVESSRLRVEAYGETRPLIQVEYSESDREQNRRVEFIRIGRTGS